jgi:hypothetical protein
MKLLNTDLMKFALNKEETGNGKGNWLMQRNGIRHFFDSRNNGYRAGLQL